jgi:ABC-2 type transport system permease protein
MRHIPTLVRRELAAYFFSPIAYLILIAFQVIAAINFGELVRSLSTAQNEYSGLSDPLNAYIASSGPFWFAVMFAVPALTMRLLAEERRSGTIEALLTVPVTELEVVVSKWLAGVVMFWALLLPFAVYLPFLRHYGQFPFDLGPVIGLAIGLTTVGMMFVAIGLFFSALTRNQIIAAVLTFCALFLVVFLSFVAYSQAVELRLPMANGLKYASVIMQIHEFGVGQLDLRYLAMHLSASVFLLFLTIKLLELRRG